MDMMGDLAGMMQQVSQAAEQLKVMQNQFNQGWGNMLSPNNTAQQQMQQQQQQQQQMLQQQQQMVRLEPILMNFVSVYSNTEEGYPLANKWNSAWQQWLLKKGHAARMEQENNRLRTQFETENPDMAALRNQIGVNSIEYANQLAAALSKKSAVVEEEPAQNE